MGSRHITDEDAIQNLTDQTLAGSYDEFADTDEGAVSRFDRTVLSEIDGVLVATEWDTDEEAKRAFVREVRRMRRMRRA